MSDKIVITACLLLIHYFWSNAFPDFWARRKCRSTTLCCRAHNRTFFCQQRFFPSPSHEKFSSEYAPPPERVNHYIISYSMFEKMSYLPFICPAVYFSVPISDNLFNNSSIMPTVISVGGITFKNIYTN